MEYKKQLEEWDKMHLWHPFTQMQEYVKGSPLIIEEGQGVILRDIDGKEYIDGVSSMWCNLLGHRNKEIDKAIKEQLDKVSHTTLLGPVNIPAIKLARSLVEITPDGLNKVFYSDNGSTAIEVAIKMAFQYWQQKGEKTRARRRFVALTNAYHGDTIGAVSLGGIELFHKLYKPLLFDVIFAPSPYCYRCPLGKTEEDCNMDCLAQLETIVKTGAEEIVAVVIEPLVQGAGGIIVHPKGYLRGVREICNKYNVLLILDEVLTGFGRTGRLFACMHESVVPDIMALAKGINGGYMPLAATICTDEIYNCFLGRYEEKKTFFHGHTYTGNPLACAAGLTTIEILGRDSVIENIQPKIKILEKGLKEFYNLKHVGNIRQCGLIAGIELVKDAETKEPFEMKEQIGIRVCLEARKRGLLIRPLEDVIVILPPLVISESDLVKMLEIIKVSISVVTSAMP